MPLDTQSVWAALGAGSGADLQQQVVASVVVDSREAVPGSLFVALPGERTDGHLFVADAFQRGAQLAIVERPIEGYITVDTQRPWHEQPQLARELRFPWCLQVPDSLRALQQLAAFWRARQSACRVVGITGSVGKTSTKELVAGVLARRFRTLKSEGNYNNEIGLPLTMLRLDSTTEWAVQEMGMYGRGEIARLAEIAQPEIGVVTNVGHTHLERLGSIEAIALAKAELVEALPADGWAVLNGDDERVRAMAARTPARNIVYYGEGPHNDLMADELRSLGLEGIGLRMHWRGETVHVRLPLLGRHSVFGVLAATAVGLVLGLHWEEVLSGLKDSSVQARLLVVPGLHGSTILDDTYNASPASVIAALNLLADMQGRKVAVLGDMLELGSFEVEGHRLVGRRAAEVADILLTVGERASSISKEAIAVGMAPNCVRHAQDLNGALALMKDMLQAGDFVLVKGSRGMAMDGLVSQLARGD